MVGMGFMNNGEMGVKVGPAEAIRRRGGWRRGDMVVMGECLGGGMVIWWLRWSYQK
jgi:hypothetical protein